MKNKVNLSVALRSILFWATVGVVSVPYNMLAFLLIPLPVRIRHRIVISWAYIFAFFAKHINKINYTITGLENLIKGPAIIASNHQSIWETIVFTTLFPQHVWILKKEILKIPFFGWAIFTLSPIAIDRSKGSGAIQQILRQSINIIKNGFWILAFPEGTRVKPGNKQPFKIGVAKMAQALKLPIIPVSHNAGYAIPKSSFWLFPGKIDIVVDKPIYSNISELPEDLTLRLEGIVLKNLSSIKHMV